jgi:hypothetical protein
VLVALRALDLEAAMQLFADGKPLSGSAHALAQTDGRTDTRAEVDAALRSWWAWPRPAPAPAGASANHPHGPVLLAWAAILAATGGGGGTAGASSPSNP